ncbi:unnamed protein product [Absidia cylindrospora]
MTILNKVGASMRQWTVATPKPCLFSSTIRRPTANMGSRPPATITQCNNNTLSQQYRSMATVQSTTDVASAWYHFKKQKHLPYFLEYLMWVVFGSECLHLIWIKSEYKEYKEHTQLKIALFNDLLALLESNSPVPESLREEIRMVMLNEKSNTNHAHQDSDIEDDYLEKLIAASEEAERMKATQSSSSTTTPSPTASDVTQSSSDNHTKTDAPGGKEVKKPSFLI